MSMTFPAIDPYDSGTLDVGDGHRVYWECCGNPGGRPAVYLHGEPGAGCTPGARRFFDLGGWRVFPQEWDRFAAAVPDTLRHLPLVDAYATLLFDADPAVREHAAREWCVWEDAHVSLTPGHRPNPRFDDSELRLRFARLVTHYWRHAAFLEDDQLICDAPKLNGIPGVLIHGRYDVSGPLETAWRLSQRWTTSRLQVIDDGGEGAFLAAIVDALHPM